MGKIKYGAVVIAMLLAMQLLLNGCSMGIVPETETDRGITSIDEASTENGLNAAIINCAAMISVESKFCWAWPPPPA